MTSTMRRNNKSLQFLTITAMMLSLWLVIDRCSTAQADTANAPSLTISQLKITSANGQFITLYNETDETLDMSKYQLEYFNNYDLSKATSSKLITLSGSVPPHGYFMVSDDAVLLCYRLTVDSVSLGLSSTAGLVEVLAFSQSGPGSSVNPVLQDYVAWSKTAAASGAQTLPTNAVASLLRRPVDAQNNPAVLIAGAGSWQAVQPDPANPCGFVKVSDNLPVAAPTTNSGLLPTSEASATIESLIAAPDAAAGPTLPSTDIGLMAPSVTELLPNPSGTGNDKTDEFIELYNPNPTDFDLSGFILQSGTTSLHTSVFPAGTKLAAKSFKAFYATDTGLSLSNSGGQVKLLDPFGNPISGSDIYNTAKDGVSWALAKGKWYWTSKLTPNATNVINQTGTVSKKSKTSSSKAKSGTAPKGSAAAISLGASSSDDTGDKSPVHIWTLAAIAGLALLYGAYEYRRDVANRFYELRRHLSARRANRP